MGKNLTPAPVPDARTVDIGAIIDAARFGPVQWLVFSLSLICMTFEGYDTYAVSYIGPHLLSLWQLTPATLGVIFTAGTLGMAAAYLAIGPIADHIGRRLPVILGTTAIGIASLLSATSGGAREFLTWRILVGLALGAVLPNIVSIAAEMMPRARRSLVVVVLYSGFAIGSALAGVITSQLMPSYGWGSVLVVGGIAPLALALVMLVKLPESPRFMALRDAADPRLRQLMQRIAAPAVLPAQARLSLPGEQLRRQPIRDLFRDGRSLSTVMVWLVLTMDVTTIGALVYWIPTLLSSAGHSAAQGINFSVVLLLGGIIGAFLIGWCMDRFGIFRILIPAHLLAMAFIMLFAGTLKASPVIVAFLIGLTLNGGTSGTQGLLARLYPTALRATGVGWASAVSRLIGIAQPLLIGVMLSAHWTPATTVFACGLPAIISTVALVLLSRDRFGVAAERVHTT